MELLGYVTGKDLDDFAHLNASGKCRSCRFWSPNEEPTYPDEHTLAFAAKLVVEIYLFLEYTGHCLRYPPTVVVIENEPESYFPITRWDQKRGEYDINPEPALFSEAREP